MTWQAALAWTIRPDASIRQIPALRPSSVSAKVAACADLRSISLPTSTARRMCGTIRLHAPARFVVDDAVAFAAEYPEQRRRGHRLVQHRGNEIDQALRLGPLLVELRFQKFVIGHQIRGRDRLPDIGEVMAGRGGIELYVFFEIEIPIIRIDAGIVIDIAGSGDRALGKDRRRLTADKPSGLADDVMPQREVERGIIDLADKLEELRFVTHGSILEDPGRKSSSTRVAELPRAAGVIGDTPRSPISAL